MARLGQFRRDTDDNWLVENPIIAEGEFILVAPDSEKPKDFRYWKVGDGINRYADLPYHQDATEGMKAYYLMHTPPFDKNLTWLDITVVHDGEDPDQANPAAIIEARARIYKDGQWIVITDPLKVDKIKGKGLSTNDFTDELKTLLESILPKVGVSNGIASLNDQGKVPANQLPSYVDEIYSVDTFTSLPNIGSDSVIYSVRDTQKTYRWDGHIYVPLYELALGEVINTAYPGNKGKQNADDIAALKKGKVDAVAGKVLSTNDFSDYLKVKLIELSYITEIGGGLQLDPETGRLSVIGLEEAFNYEKLSHLPQINSVELIGNKSWKDLGLDIYLGNYTYAKDKLYTQTQIDNKFEKLQPKEDGKGLSTNDFTNEYKQKVDTLVTDMQDVKTELLGVSDAVTNLGQAAQ